MLKPSVREYSMQSSENVDQMLDARTSIIHPITSRKTQSTWEDLLTSDNIRSPVQRMATIIDSAAALG
jgi:hypothetical protein